MNYKLNEEEIRMVKELAKEMKEEANQKFSIKKNMEISLASRIESVDEKKEVEELCSGIHEFDAMLHQMEKGGKELIVETLNKSVLDGKSTEEQYVLLAEILEGGHRALAGNPKYNLEEQEAFSIKKDGDITEEDLEQIKLQAACYLNEFALLHGEGEAMESLLGLIGREALKDLQKAYEKEEETYYMALAIYILQMEGNLEGIPAGMGAKGIGASVAAALASIKTQIQGLLGKISKEKVLETLKNIAAAALTILVATAITVVSVKAVQIVFSVTAALLGYGILGLFVATVFAVGSGVEVTTVLLEWKEDAIRLMKEAKGFAVEKYGVVRQWTLETALPAWKQFWDSLKERVSAFMAKNETAETKEETEEAEIEIGEEAAAEA